LDVRLSDILHLGLCEKGRKKKEEEEEEEE
jgi:hypothetical protein